MSSEERNAYLRKVREYLRQIWARFDQALDEDDLDGIREVAHQFATVARGHLKEFADTHDLHSDEGVARVYNHVKEDHPAKGDAVELLRLAIVAEKYPESCRALKRPIRYLLDRLDEPNVLHGLNYRAEQTAKSRRALEKRWSRDGSREVMDRLIEYQRARYRDHDYTAEECWNDLLGEMDRAGLKPREEWKPNEKKKSVVRYGDDQSLTFGRFSNRLTE